MSRSVTIGNGNLLVGIDHRGQVRDLYFPYVGHSNHVSGASGSYYHRVGVWVNGNLKWLSDSSWNIEAGCNVDSATSNICAYNEQLQIRLTISDAVHNEKNIFLRRVRVVNESGDDREIKVFFNQEFRISESRRGDTAFYDPRVKAIVHYKGHVAMLVNALVGEQTFDDFTVGLFDIEGKRGTYSDAEDGVLSKNTVEHGSVDSTIGLTFYTASKKEATVYYWIAAGTNIQEAHDLDAYVRKETPERLISSTERYWRAWMNKESRDLSKIDVGLQNLYQRSLAIIRVHSDNRGGIIASSDSDMLNQGRDTYSYVWPRDAAINANALDRAGYIDTTQQFFRFITSRMEEGGYLMHKYRSDGVLGSSWHPWFRNGKAELPIQEDETALIVYMLYKHYLCARDLEFIESLYNSFIEPAADFMCGYIEAETGLPSGSYDLWEEKYGASTYTAASVYGALQAAAEVSALLGKRENAEKYRDRAALIKTAILTYLFDADSGMFVKLARQDDSELVVDRTVDISSFHGIVFFEVLDPLDRRVQSAFKVVSQKLRIPTDVDGYIRYEGDNYYRTSRDTHPNPWCITTLWVAQYYIKCAQSKADLRDAYEILQWTLKHATESGILPEQLHPYTGEHLSTAPLVWSHAEFVITVDEYLKKLKTFA